MKIFALLIIISAWLLGLVGCTPTGGSAAMKLVQSNQERIMNPQVNTGDQAALTTGNNAFAFSLYQYLSSQPGNLIFSPFSISEALAMTYAGAQGETAQQMASALHFTLPQDRLHPAFNALDQQLNNPANGGSDQGFNLSVVNALWGQQGFTFLPAFLDTLSQNYGAGMRLLDFQNAPDPSRQTINNWVSDQTKQKIKDLLPQGSIMTTTRLVLTNAIYFKASWTSPFDANKTKDRPFFLLDGTQISVPSMQETEDLGYATMGDTQAVELAYANSDLSMVILLPKAGSLDALVANLDAANLDSLLSEITSTHVTLTLPKFTFNSSFDLRAALSTLGMPDAFTSGKADFSGMDGQQDLLIQGVLHKAFIAVDEQGTVAAAATGIMVGISALPLSKVQVTVDHPFIFLIVNHNTGTILFIGRVVDPRS